MGLLRGWSIGVLGVLHIYSVTVWGADLSLPLNANSIQKYFAAHPNNGVEQFLGDLPTSYTGSFVLMHDSRSLQQATYEKPRLIFFGPDARFLLAVGNVAADPRFSTLEFGEFDEKLGSYHYGEINLTTPGKPNISTDVPMCATCHGTHTRPIWGQYPTWTGAYSDETGAIASADSAGFAQFLLSKTADPRYSNLQFSSGSGSQFLLTSRAYPYPNTDLNHELGNTIAQGTLTRMHLDPNFDKKKWAVLATSDAFDCIDTDAWFDISPKVQSLYTALPAENYAATSLLFVEGLRLFGIDPDLELSIEAMVPELANPNLTRTYGQWQTGAYRLDEALAFDLIDETVATDPQLATQFASVKETMQEIHSWLALTGEARATALKGDDGAHFDFFDVFDPINNSKKSHEAVCAYYASQL